MSEPKLNIKEETSAKKTRSPPKKPKVEQSVPRKKKLKTDADKAAERAQHLRFGKAEITPDEASRMTKQQKRAMYAAAAARSAAHREVDQYEDDNVGTQALNEGVKSEEAVSDFSKNRYARKLKKKAKLQAKKNTPTAKSSAFGSDKAQSAEATSSEGNSNWCSRWWQKQDIQKSYRAATRSGGTTAQTAGGKAVSNGTTAAKSGMERVIDKGKSVVSTAANGIANFAKSNAHVLLIVGVFLLLLLLVMSAFSSCSILFSGTTQVSGQTIYTAEDRDIRGAETDYKKLEKELDKKITPKTKVVAVAMVSNVLGLRAPVEEIVKRAHAVGAVVVLDCAQSAPHTPVDVKKLDVDFAACSAHKLYAPMGVGALYARAGLLEKMPPFMSGGDMIGAVHESGATWADGPRKFEAGTRNVGGEVGFAAAIDYMKGIGWEAMETHEHALLDRMLAGMRAMPWLTVYGEPVAEGRYGVVSFNVNDVHPHDVATILDAGGVAVRAGHHCAQPLMEFLGIGSCCRASVAIYNTPEDVDALLENLENVRKVMGL